MPFCRMKQVFFTEKHRGFYGEHDKNQRQGPVVENRPLSLEWRFRLRSEQAQLTGGGLCMSGQFYSVEV